MPERIALLLPHRVPPLAGHLLLAHGAFVPRQLLPFVGRHGADAEVSTAPERPNKSLLLLSQSLEGPRMAKDHPDQVAADAVCFH